MFKGKKRELTAARLRLRWKRLARSEVARRTLRSFEDKLRRRATTSLEKAKEPASSITTRRSRACGRPTATRCSSSWSTPDYDLLRDLTHARRSRRSRAKSSRRTATRAAGRWPIRSAPGRTCSRNGGAGSRSCSRRIPNYREETFPGCRARRTRAIVRAMKGKRLPQIGRVEIAIIEESNPRLLAFNSDELDYVDVPRDLVAHVLDDEQHAAAAIREGGVTLQRGVKPALAFFVLQHERSRRRRLHAGEVALRRAILMALQPRRQIRVVRRDRRVARRSRSRRSARPRSRDQGARRYDPARRARCSTSSATRIATATACASCPTASRSC